MNIAVDVNGGDKAPDVIMEGALKFISVHPECGLILCTDRQTSIDLTSKYPEYKNKFDISEHSIGMNETPAVSKKDKPDNTISGAVRAVKENRADCAFSCGNSGAIILNSADILGLNDKNYSPALLSFIPMFNRAPLAIFDVGALGNRNFVAEEYFFHMSEVEIIYSKLFGINKPSVKLLNIGIESWKGTPEHKKLYKMLEESKYGFTGNLEGDGLLNTDANIIITGGFTGNIILKLLESFNELSRNFRNLKDCHAENNLLNFYSEEFSYESVGAALLLGVNGKIAIGHGKSTSEAVFSGLELCLKYCKN